VIEDKNLCVRCATEIPQEGGELCVWCQPIEDASRLLQRALVVLAEDRTAEAARLIEDAETILRLE